MRPSLKLNLRAVALGVAFVAYHAVDYYAGLTHGWLRVGLVVVSGLLLLIAEPPVRRDV